MHNDLRIERWNSKGQNGPDFAWTLLTSITENRKLATVFLVTLLVGIFSSSPAQKAALCAVIGIAALVAVYSSKRRGTLQPVSRTAGSAVVAPQRYSSTLLLNTITHITRIEMLIKRPRGLAASQEKP